MSFEDIDLQWFAAEDEGRTEDPSEYKLRKAREEGRVPKSQDLCSSVVMFVTVAALIVLAPYIWRSCEEVVLYYFTHCTESEVFQPRFYRHFVLTLAKIVLPVAILGSSAAFIANIAQNKGFIFTLKPIEPNFSKILPKVGQYLKKTIFSQEGFFNVVKSIGKVAAVIFIAVMIIRSNVYRILELLNAGSIYLAVGRISTTAAKILVSCAVLFLLISIPDFFMQKKQFMETQKMTKHDVKEEYKEMEGDPQVKAKLQQAQRDLLQRNIPQQVAKSDVVITNPTHFAVALLYESANADAPQVMAKGTDSLALRIKEIARENDVPIVENKSLARSLYTETDVGDIIPSAYFSVIATIYGQLEKFRTKS